MIETLFIWSLCVFFPFYLWNYSDILLPIRVWLTPRLPALVAYVTSCSLCFCWWVTLIAWPVAGFPFYFIFAAPTVSLFLGCGFKRLQGGDK